MKRVLFQIHLWMGLVLSLPFVALGLTGSILVFHEDIERAFAPKAALHAAAGAPQPLDAIAAAALAEGPQGARVNLLQLPDAKGDPAIVRLGQRGQGPRGGITVEVDPVSLAAAKQNPGAAAAFMQTMHRLHGNFLLEGRTGRPIVGWAGAAMLVMGISGIVLWWPKSGQWRRAFGVRIAAPAYRVNRDLHGATGIWFWAVFIVVTFSGVYISFPKPFAQATVAMLSGRDLRTTADAIRAEKNRGAALSFEAAASAARAAVPDARLRSIAAPARPGQPMRVGMAQPGWTDGAPFVTVYLDPRDGRVLEVRDPRRYAPGETVQAWMRPLHDGHGLGVVWKFLVFLSGLLPLLFVVTGIVMWLRKNGAQRAAEAEHELESA